MKICFVVGLYPFNKGGAEYQAKILSENFIRNHDVFFIMNLPESKEREITYNGFRIYNFSFSPLIDMCTCYFSVYKQISLIVKKEKPDIIYHRVIMPYSWHITQIAKNNNIPIVLHVASNHSVTFDNNVISKLRKMLLKKIIRSGVNIISQSPEQSLLLSEITNKKIHVLPNLIYYRESEFIYKNKFNIVWIGKSVPIKQLDIFLDIADQMKKNPDINFVIISRFFDDSYSNNLIRRIESMKNVTNIGERDNTFINDYLNKSAYLLVNTSLSEGFSNTFLQAWSYGVPVISLNSNPGEFFFEFNVGGFCNNELQKIVYYINNLISNTDYYYKVAENCKKMVFNNFSVEELFPKYETFFKEILNK